MEKLYKKNGELEFSPLLLNAEDPEIANLLKQTKHEYIHSIGEKGMALIHKMIIEGSECLNQNTIIIQIHQHF